MRNKAGIKTTPLHFVSIFQPFSSMLKILLNAVPLLVQENLRIESYNILWFI